MARQCRAVVVSEYGAPDVMQLTTKPVPQPEAGQVQLRVEAAGVNPSDTYQRLGPGGPWAKLPHLLPKLPYTPGKDGAGVITAVGAGVSAFSVGDRVYTNGSLTGTFAEYAVCTVAQVFPLPDGVSFAEGAGVGVPAATAYKAIWPRGGLQAGDSLLIHGASGAVGLAATNMASAAGCTVVGTAGSAAGEAAVLAAGAVAAVNHKAEGYLAAAVAALPDGCGGFDVLLENAAHANLPADMGVMAKGGRVCIVGSKAQEVGLNPRLTMPKEVDIRGVFLSASSPDEIGAIHAELYKLMVAGSFKPVVGMTLGLEQAALSHVEVMAPSAGGAVGNIVVAPQQKAAM